MKLRVENSGMLLTPSIFTSAYLSPQLVLLPVPFGDRFFCDKFGRVD